MLLHQFRAVFERRLAVFNDFHRLSPVLTGFQSSVLSPPAERFSPGFTGFHRTQRSPSPGGAKVNSGATRGLLLPSLAWVLSRASQQGECALRASRLPKDACVAHKWVGWRRRMVRGGQRCGQQRRGAFRRAERFGAGHQRGGRGNASSAECQSECITVGVLATCRAGKSQRGAARPCPLRHT